MQNHWASGLTENTDHGGRFQLKKPTSDSFFRRKIQLAWRTCYSGFNWPELKIYWPGPTYPRLKKALNYGKIINLVA